MYPNENFRKIAKIFIVAFLCSQMESSFTQENASDNRSPNYAYSVNGSMATLERAKYLASIRLKALDKIFGEGHVCAGTIIAPSVVLTAAQCVYDYKNNQQLHPSELKVVMGTVSRFEPNEHTLSYAVTHIYQPKGFDPIRLHENIAILMLEKDIPDYHPTVQAVNFNRHTALSKTAASQNFELISWGTTKQGLPLDQALLLNATGVSSELCEQHMFPLFNAASLMCLDLRSTASHLPACPEDAGAPLMHQNVLYGLSTFAPGCAIKTQPMLFTDVAHHAQWIMQQIGTGTNHNSSIWGTLGFLLFTMYTLRSLRVFKW